MSLFYGIAAVLLKVFNRGRYLAVSLAGISYTRIAGVQKLAGEQKLLVFLISAMDGKFESVSAASFVHMKHIRRWGQHSAVD